MSVPPFAPGGSVVAPGPVETLPIRPRRSMRAPSLSWLRLLLGDGKARTGVLLLCALLLVAVVGPLLWPGDPMAADYTIRPQQPPSAHHWLGTDQLGHDVFLQMIHGARPTLQVGLAIGLLTTLIAVAVGLTAGSLGGLVDETLMLLANIMLVFPGFPLIIVVSSWVRVTNDIPVILVISLTSWAWGARVLRSQALTIRNRDFIAAAVLSGESRTRIIFTEVMPNMISLIASSLIGTITYGIMASAGLQFLGFGNINEVNWFTILYWAQNASALQVGAWWTFVPPGLAIGLVGVGLSLTNYGIDQISNPRLRVGPKQRRQRRTPRRIEPAQVALG